MTKMTAACFGVLVLVTYFSTQVSSQNATTPAPGNDTTVTMASNSTMMQTTAYSSTANVTTPSGASFTRSGVFSILIPVAMAASLVFSRC
ncbi:hypothetical protein SKAU_G00420950 [Synaphobranchus kaupii]|uniref:Uncharacterized protein n=1 Tax=Synaphobranchus kaupii TaxID=118154 RepID=A0A9Q1E6L9_SYNKA|nr:hypothetical protein SKAU_G00420950 [Synaphobranchus kaupii]